MHGTGQDITQRKLIEQELKESEERYRTLFETAAEGILIADVKNKTIQFSNAAAEKMFGYSSGELSNLSINKLHPLESLDRVTSEFEAMAAGEKALATDLPCLKKDGTLFYANINGAPVKIGDTEYNAGFFTDITEHKKLVEERQRMDKLASVGTMAGGITHDFNNLLTGIIGNIDLALLQIKTNRKAKEILSEAENVSLQARDLTKQLLTFTKDFKPVKSTISIGKLLKDTSDFTLRGSNVTPLYSIPVDLWQVEADEGQINQAITNLVLNADQAMPDGGEIHIKGENFTLSKTGEIPLPNGQYIKITIEDHGIGIPEEYLGRIFEPYFTTKGTGSGLGLTSTYSIINKHEGYISVESRISKGTKFSIYIPASERKNTPVKEDHSRSHKGKGKILVMDDDEIIRQMLSKMLPVIGYEVKLAANGAEALNLFSKAQEMGKPFDAVILDLTIHGGNGGKETIQKLIEIDPKVKAIVSSGYSTDPVLDNYRDYGFSAIITKPYSVNQLEETLYSVLSKKK